MADIYLAITTAATVHFAQPDALKVRELVQHKLLWMSGVNIYYYGMLYLKMRNIQKAKNNLHK